MNVSDFFKIGKGHANMDFVDVYVNGDVALFIDPCLIETVSDDFCKNAKIVLVDYFDAFYKLYHTKATYQVKHDFFSHAHELNYTKLGYGNGNNGKAKTAEGMIDTFSDVERLMDKKIDMCHAIDLPIFIENFAEDCMSDMITNILFKNLNEFTIQQCKKYGVQTQKSDNEHYYWDVSSHNWEKYQGEYLVIDKKIIVLVPKNIVRNKYFYSAGQYFSSVIVERAREEKAMYDAKGKKIPPQKGSIEKELLENVNKKQAIVRETAEHPDCLKRYHNQMGSAYQSKNMDDKALDEFIYKDKSEDDKEERGKNE